MTTERAAAFLIGALVAIIIGMVAGIASNGDEPDGHCPACAVVSPHDYLHEPRGFFITGPQEIECVTCGNRLNLPVRIDGRMVRPVEETTP